MKKLKNLNILNLGKKIEQIRRKHNINIRRKNRKYTQNFQGRCIVSRTAGKILISYGFTKVKFQLACDTLEPMLRSMTYINEQLSFIRHSFIFMIVIYDDEFGR